jgi:DNA-binding NarL/FixJ family response regulator
MIVDDHPLVRDGIIGLVDAQGDFTVVAEAGDGIDAIAKFEEHRPDVILMDLQMPGLSGLEAIKEIRKRSSSVKILVLTTYLGDAQITRAIQAGASGYLLKSSVRKELLDAIRRVETGGSILSPEVADELASHILEERLTDREVEILRLVADGRANKQIAWDLDLSIETVRAHLKNVYEKLGADDRTHAVTVAIRRGFLEP